MDEIITRWATDLSKYQKEFKDQAAKVAEWDRLLVTNGEKIQKLYLGTYEAERASNEIERQLASVESQQDELASWLDRYEAEVEDLFAKRVGDAEHVAGPDQERERTYKLAEKLTDRLDEMGKDLGKMIKEINDMSGTLQKGGKTDDPVRFFFFFLYSFTAGEMCGQQVANGQKPVEPDCARPQRPSQPAAVDRHQCCCAPGQGHGCAEGEREHGQPVWRPGERCGGELLPVVHGASLRAGITAEG